MSQHFFFLPVLKKFVFIFIILSSSLILPRKTLSAAIPNQWNLPQFTAGGHVMVFQPQGFYVAGIDHILHVGFVDSTGSPFTICNSGLKSNSVPSPTTGRYGELWPGIRLRYAVVAGSIAQSTWEISPGADAARILLRYNMPVAIGKNGSLNIKQEFIESSHFK